MKGIHFRIHKQFATCLFPEPDQSIPCLSIPFISDPFNIFLTWFKMC